MPIPSLVMHRLPALLLAAICALPAQAANYVCTTTAMRGNKWICKETPSVCTFSFVVNYRSRSVERLTDGDTPRVKVQVDKWDDKVLIAHEDQARLDSRFVEQYFYKIEFDGGAFLMANEYVTNHGRYLKQEELDMSDRKRFSYYKPKLFSETGRCRVQR